MTLVLAFDTSTEALAIGLGRVESGRLTVVATHDVSAPRAAMSRLLPSVRDLLDAEGLEPTDLGVVAVGRGPGSFTGVRIGVATAKGIARGLGVPLHGIGTLDAVARRLPHHEGLVGVVGDAMRGEVYPALFRDGARLGEDRVCAPDEAAAEWAALGEPVLLTGNGLAKHAEVILAAMRDSAELAPQESWAPTGESLLTEYVATHDPAGPGDPALLLPVYTRLSDAEEAERARSGASGTTPGSGVCGSDGGGV